MLSFMFVVTFNEGVKGISKTKVRPIHQNRRQNIAISSELELQIKFKNTIFHKKEQKRKTNTPKLNWYKCKISRFWHLQS